MIYSISHIKQIVVRSTHICRIKGWQVFAGGARWGMESLSYAKYKNYCLQSMVNRDDLTVFI